MNAPLIRGLRTINLWALLPLLIFLCLWTNQNCVSQEIASHDAALLATIKPKVDYKLDSDGNVVSIFAKKTQSGFDAFGKFPKLRQLSIYGYSFKPDDPLDLSQLNSLTSLSLSNDFLFPKEETTCPPLPNSLESLNLYITKLDKKSTLTIVENLTNLTSLALPGEFNDEQILRLKELKKLNKLWLMARSGKQGFTSYPPRAAFCFRLLVDLQGRSIKEACDVLGLLENDMVTLPLTDKTTPYITRLQGVTKLDLDLRSISQAGLSKFEIPTNVTSLCLRDGQINETLLKKMSSLQSLELYYCSTGGDSLSFLQSFNSLKVLQVESREKKRVVIPSNLKRLEELSLSCDEWEIDNLPDIASLESLKKLKLSVKNTIDDSFLKNLTGLKQLSQIELADATVTAGVVFDLFDGLTSQPRSTVDVGGFKFVRQESGLEFGIGKKTPVSNELVSRVANLKNLKKFYISSSSNLITADVDRVIEMIGHFEQVEKVVLLNLEPSIDNVFGVLDPLKSKKLVWLKFGRYYDGFFFKKKESGIELRIGKEMPVTSQLLSKLSSVKAQKIGFSKSSLQQNDLPELAQILAEQVSFSSCENVTDKTVELLSRNQNIKSLRFYGCDEVTDEAVSHLEQMKWLETLKVKSENVSAATLESLKSKLPNCKIE